MLLFSRKEDIPKMNQYYRASDMIKLLKYFPDLSPVTDLTIVENEDDYQKNIEYINTLKNHREDTIKRNINHLNTDNKDIKENYLEILREIKNQDKDAVLVLFNTEVPSSERYMRYAGISIGVLLNEYVKIDAVGKGFDGREVSKNMYTHERFDIPWFELRNVTIDNFRNFRTFLISDEEYKITRNERVKFLTKIGYDEEIVNAEVPETYKEIPDFIWMDVIKNFLKILEKEEDILYADGMTDFSISGHTEGKRYLPWQLFDKTRMGNV